MTPTAVRIGLVAAWAAAGLLAFGWVSGIEAGPIAILQILSPHLALACLLLVPVAVLSRSRALALALGVTAVLFGARFGGEWWSPGAGGRQGELGVATWNLQVGARATPETIRLLRETTVDVIALQELTPVVAASIQEDPVLSTRFPYRALGPSLVPAGVGLLSRYPIGSVTYGVDPIRVEARVALPDGEIVVINAHPYPVRFGLVGGIPISFDPTQKNAWLELIRRRAAELEARGETVLLIGDFNTAPTERAFGRLTVGLLDAHAEVGLGPGWTWRPGRFALLGIGLLRIDLVLSTADLVPTRTQVTCPAGGDHCMLQAWLRREDPP